MGIIEIEESLGFGMFLGVGGFRGGRLERVKRGGSMGIRCCFQFSGRFFNDLCCMTETTFFGLFAQNVSADDSIYLYRVFWGGGGKERRKK